MVSEIPKKAVVSKAQLLHNEISIFSFDLLNALQCDVDNDIKWKGVCSSRMEPRAINADQLQTNYMQR